MSDSVKSKNTGWFVFELKRRLTLSHFMRHLLLICRVFTVLVTNQTWTSNVWTVFVSSSRTRSNRSGLTHVLCVTFDLKRLRTTAGRRSRRPRVRPGLMNTWTMWMGHGPRLLDRMSWTSSPGPHLLELVSRTTSPGPLQAGLLHSVDGVKVGVLLWNISLSHSRCLFTDWR